MIIYIENPKDATRKWLELINEYSKFAGYRIKTQISLAFLYRNNEKSEREIKETTIHYCKENKNILRKKIYLKKQKTCI